MTKKKGSVSKKDADKSLVKFAIGNKATVNEFLQLQERYDSIKNEPEKAFFLGIADYVKFISESPGLDAIAASVKKMEKDDEQDVLRLEKKLQKELKLVEKELYKIINDNDLDYFELKEAISHYEGIKDGHIQSSATMEEALYGGIAGIIRAIFNHNNKDFVRKYLTTFPHNDNISGYTIAASYADYKDELHNFRSLRKTSVWGAWDRLVLVYLVIHRHKEELKGLDPIKNVWKRMNFVGLRGEMEKIIEKKSDRRIEFIQDEYKIHLRRVHEHIASKSGGKEFANLAKSMSKYVKDISSSLALPVRFIDDMRQATEQVAKFADQYKSVTTSIVEPARRANQWGDQLRELAKSVNETPKIELPEISPAKDVARTLAPSDLKTSSDVTNELLIELIQINKEALVERKLFRELLSGVLGQPISEVTREAPALIAKTPSKRKMQKYINGLKRQYALTKTEVELLKKLSDFEAYSLKEIEKAIGSRGVKHIKSKLSKKIEKEWIYIHTKRGGYYGSDQSTYQLRQKSTEQ